MLIAYLIVIISFFTVGSVGSGFDRNEYDVRNISRRLSQDADAVIRRDEIRFEVVDNNTAYLEAKIAVTIFNKDEQDYGKRKLWYDKFRNIENIKGIIYDADGEVVRELEDSDIKDYTDFEAYTVYSDNRIKYIELYHNKFPYTVEYNYKFSYNGYLHWPTWYSRTSTDPVEYSDFQVITPAGFNLRYWCNKAEAEPEIILKDHQKIYKWVAENLLKLAAQAEDEDIEDYATIVRIAPSNFEIEGYKGNMDSWKNFGLWYNSLTNEKDVLPETASAELKKIIGLKSDPKEIVADLYSYMQSKTRYVSIQLGIGSWQPYDASYVYKNGYGDCKALSNYMVSILSQAGITAYPVLINSGHSREPLINEFPSNQFNHVIVNVPFDKDTIWLECTSQLMPPGSIGWSNENRNALMVTKEGGVIVQTPSSSSEKNIQIKKIDVKLSLTGEAEVKAKIKWYGNQHDFVIHNVEKSSSAEKEKWIKNLLEVPDIKLSGYAFDFDNKKLAEVGLLTEMTILRFGSISGSRIFFNPNLMERNTSVPQDFPERRSPVRFKYPYKDVDSVFYTIPEKFKVEALPKEINIQTFFGRYTSRTIDKGDNTVLFFRSLEISDYSIPPENYPEYKKFFADVVKTDKQQVVLVKVK